MQGVKAKFDARVKRLADKMMMSQVQVPGFITSLSGTDSVLAFIIAYEAGMATGMMRHEGIHYINPKLRRGWFHNNILDWLQDRCPRANISVEEPLGGNQDQQRWADLHLRALNTISDGFIRTRDAADTFWVVGTINATEYELGTYSQMATTASLQPIRTIDKSDVLKMCEMLGVPKIAMEHARQPDCFCGRDELAAQNIELIDDIIRFRVGETVDPKLLATLMGYVADLKRENGFKRRIPYLV